MIQEQLKEAGLPLDLVYLPMIESGYSLTAYSKAKAVGPWQFMQGTGLNFGLQVTNYVDERRDPVKSTTAAIAYLKSLYAEFNSWELAVAGYNAGEGRIRRGIKKYNTHDFWELAEHRFLPSETKLYVPKLIAAILIAKNPEKYGFGDIQLEEPLKFEYAQVPRWTSLRAVATALGADFDEINNLNRELTKHITPPDQEQYELKIPPGSQKLLASNLPRVRVTVTTQYKTHTIRKGDTLDKICRNYNLNKTTLLKANDLRHSKMPAGKVLRIPYSETKYVLLSEEEMNRSELAHPGGNSFLHKIKPGETVAEIASKYNVTPHLIASWNGLKNIHKIRAGQQLTLYILNASSPNSGLAKQETVAKKEEGKNGTKIITGPRKKVASPKVAPLSPTYYQVKGGDSLWKIAKRFNIEAKDIMRWNNLKNKTIQPGLKLVIKVLASR
jgi:membrane-bound lytic murein transglycosylase D